MLSDATARQARPRYRRRARLVLVCLALAAMGGCRRHGAELAVVRGERAERERLAASRHREVRLPDPLPLQTAISLALEKNLEAAAARLQEQIEVERLTGRRLNMLPSLRWSGEDSRMDEPRATTSVSVDTGQVSLEPSTSTEKTVETWDLNAVWSLLDFGLSYVRARQARDRVAVQEEQVRRVEQNLVLDVITAYWRVQVAQAAADRAAELAATARDRRERLERQIAERMRPETEALEEHKRLLQTEIRLSRYERDLAVATSELGRLMGVGPKAQIRLPAWSPGEEPPVPALDLESLEIAALENRPELYQRDLEERIAAEEVRAGILEMFPNVSLFARRSHDANKYLYKHYITTTGATAAWELLQLPSKYSEVRARRQEVAIARKRRLLLALGVVTQVHVAAFEFEEAARQVRLSARLDSVQKRLLAALRKREEQGDVEAGRVFAAEVDAFFTRLRDLSARADLAVAAARLENVAGRLPSGSLAEARRLAAGEVPGEPPGDEVTATPTAAPVRRAMAPPAGPAGAARTEASTNPPPRRVRLARPSPQVVRSSSLQRLLASMRGRGLLSEEDYLAAWRVRILGAESDGGRWELSRHRGEAWAPLRAGLPLTLPLRSRVRHRSQPGDGPAVLRLQVLDIQDRTLPTDRPNSVLVLRLGP
jgi:outer membrane protein TolC